MTQPAIQMLRETRFCVVLRNRLTGTVEGFYGPRIFLFEIVSEWIVPGTVDLEAE